MYMKKAESLAILTHFLSKCVSSQLQAIFLDFSWKTWDFYTCCQTAELPFSTLTPDPCIGVNLLKILI